MNSTLAFGYPSFSWRTEVDALRIAITGSGLENHYVRVESVRCTTGIRCRANMSTTLEDIGFGGLTAATATLTAENVDLQSSGGQWAAVSESARLALAAPAYAGRRFVTPSIEGDLRASNDELSARLRIATPEGGLSGRAAIVHDLSSGRGEIELDDVALDIGILNFSEAFEAWPFEWDASAGTWRIEGTVDWRQAASGFSYGGQSTHTIDSLAGNYGDIGFLGFGTRAELKLESGKTPVVLPGSFEIGLVDIGFPLEDINGRFTLDLDELAIEFEDLSLSTLGGTVRAAPFRFDPAGSNDIALDVENVQLPLMVGLANLDTVNISGSVSGSVPISINDGNVVVDGGSLEADPPGGAIRYRGGNAVAGEQLGIVTRTLENFQFEELTSEVHYNEQGDLKLQMRMTGTNPDVDPDQPVILNLGVENNIPQMLRSLQATRSIEELLEQKLSN